MLRPFERVDPGEPISASEFNRAMHEVERQHRQNVAAPLRLVSDANGTRIDIAQKPHLWVRITGHETINSGAVSDLAKYSGIEQTDDPSTDGTYDLLGGIEFYVDGLYLKEVNGRTDVPENSIVHAYQSDNGSYYTFLFEQAFDDGVSGSSACHLPESAAELAANSTQGPDAWTDGLGNVAFTLGPKCCWVNEIEEQCSDDGSHTQWRQITTYFPFHVRKATGPWEDNYPPADWNPPCE